MVGAERERAVKPWVLIIALLIPGIAHAQEFTLPRQLIALYDSREEASPRTTQIHRFLELPANYLGLSIRYHDINAPLPEMNDNVRGIIVWFNRGAEVPDAKTYLDWLERAQGQGKRLLVLENAGLNDRWRKDAKRMEQLGRVLARIGVSDTNRWQSLTYQARIRHADANMIGYERAYESVLPSYMDTRAVGAGVSYLSVSQPFGDETVTSDLVIASPRGGFVAAGYALYHAVREEDQTGVHQWYINPFLFLRETLGTDDLPKPDVTTRNGRRIAYALMDGDGWNLRSDAPGFRGTQTIAGEVVMKNIIAPSTLSFTASLIGAELDAECYGLPESAAVAKALLALPNVEAATHSMTHPLYWRFFADYGADKETPFMERYPLKPKEVSSMLGRISSWWRSFTKTTPAASTQDEAYDVPPPGRFDLPEADMLTRYYRLPRSYHCGPFNLKTETAGAIDAVQALLPTNKRVALYTWSGNTAPFEAAIRAVEDTGTPALGGGEIAFNPDYASVSGLSPIGLQAADGTLQLYGGNGSERDLQSTGLSPWKERLVFSGAPMRLAPAMLYFHASAGANAATLSLLKTAVSDMEEQSLIALPVSDMAYTGSGFFHAVLKRMGERVYRLEDGEGIFTLRFDHATLTSVDFERSQHVIGQRWFAGSLYVALEGGPNAVIALKTLEKPGTYPAATRPYLIDSAMVIKGLQIANNSLTFSTPVKGAAQMRWRMPETGSYFIRADIGMGEAKEWSQATDAEGMLSVHYDTQAKEVRFTLQRADR